MDGMAMASDELAEPRAGLIMGSDSDWPVMEAAAHALAEFDVPSRSASSRRTGPPIACSTTRAPPRAGASR